MKGYWHIAAFAAVSSALTVYFNNYWLYVGFICWIFYVYGSKRLRRFPLLASIIISLFFFEYLPTLSTPPQSSSPEEILTLTGTIVSQVNWTEKKVDFVLHSDSLDQKIETVSFLKEQANDHITHWKTKLRYGAVCELTGRFAVPKSSRNPGQFNHQLFLAKKGISYQIVVDSLDTISCDGASFMDRFYRFRDLLQGFISQTYKKDSTAWIFALVFGDDSMLSKTMIHLFQRWSLAHLLAISGLHVGLIVGFVFFLLIKLGMTTKEKTQWIIIFGLPVYAILAGGEPSVWRASLMICLAVGLAKAKLRYPLTDVISIVFLFLLIVDKYIIYQVGFQMSFLVAFTLVLSKSWLAKTPSPFFVLLKISFICQLVLLPIQFLYFSTFHPLSILINILVVPYFTLFVIPTVFIMVIFSPVPFISTVIDFIFTFIHKGFEKLLIVIDQVAYFPWMTGNFPMWSAFLYYGLLILFMVLEEKQKKTNAFICGVGLTVMVMIIVARPYFSPIGKVTMLDIGQGDAFVIELPYRRGVFMIDAGATYSFHDRKPTESVYNNIINPFLTYRGIQSVDAVFISHEDVDHMGSVGYLLKDRSVKRIVVSDQYELKMKELNEWMQAKGEVIRIKPYQLLTIKGQTFHLLSPTRNLGTPNENSLVILTEFGGERWLFTGDIGENTEEKLLSSFPNLSIDVLKVAHHGSNTSTGAQFIKAIQPNDALISVGRHNMYGHPAEEVLQVLKEEGVRIFRTDTDRAIQYQYHGDKRVFTKYKP
ncbi:DNA internalization-related competence protein ComEC/Rec2 [Virgibacillus sp. MG-45]|uniref:DNA internalization-related competence protein ComEC/Rec2 n=1 Tax=Virgibacillus sp. MG-45 TaxID=3102791 RepID=UPI002EDA1D52